MRALDGTIEEAVSAIAAGGMAIVVDAADRENEGDLVMAAERVTPDAVNFMATHARGLICVPMSDRRLDELEIGPMVTRNGDRRGTAWRVSVDHRAASSRGISAPDRAQTIAALADPGASAGDFRRPGRVFPLAACAGGILERPGHTEASIDLMVRAGLREAAVICEIAADDGEMARMPELRRLAAAHDLPLISIADLVEDRRRSGPLALRVGESQVALPHGAFSAIAYRDASDGHEHVALVRGDVRSGPPPLVGVRAECVVGDAFGSLGCDCAHRLDTALAEIVAAGRGVLVYVRGGGHAHPGASGDRRVAGLAAQILWDLGVGRARLLAGAPELRDGLEEQGVRILGEAGGMRIARSA